MVIDRARRQDGVITLGQAQALGASGKVMAALVDAGVFWRACRGVFVLVSGRSDHLTALRAAIAGGGRGSAAACRSAAYVAGLIARPPGRPQIVVPVGSASRLRGAEVRRCRPPIPVVSVQGIRCTSFPRTLVDLAAVAPAPELALAVDRALAGGRTRLEDLLSELDAGRRPGARSLRRCLAERGDLGRPDPSVLESQFARTLRRYGLPAPKLEVVAGPGGRYRLDSAYPERMLAVEVSGYAWHHSPEQMAYDQARQRALGLEGWLVLVYTWRDVVYDAERVVSEIGAAYRRRAPR